MTADFDPTERTEHWQRQLRLQDWDVRTSVVRYHDMGVALGRCRSKVHGRDAIIEITCRADLHSDASEEDRDLEVTLVHELLHLKFPPVSRHQSEALEQAIEATARALVRLDRGIRR